MNSAQRLSAALAVVALVWLGLVVGVSFIATPAKFLAPTLDLSTALDVGRHTFGVFAIVERAAAIALGVLLLLVRRDVTVVLPGAVIVLSLAAEQLWLLPLLDARVEVIMQGKVPQPSALHAAYVALEGLKLVLLSGLAWASFRRILREPFVGQR
jgi:hypothetical protein